MELSLPFSTIQLYYGVADLQMGLKNPTILLLLLLLLYIYFFYYKQTVLQTVGSAWHKLHAAITRRCPKALIIRSLRII